MCAGIVGPAFAGIVVATVIAYLMEDTFVSQAAIRIVPQQISGELVHSISSQDVSDRINGMAQQIESRNVLSSLIGQLRLIQRRTEARTHGRCTEHHAGCHSHSTSRRFDQPPKRQDLPAMKIQVLFAIASPPISCLRRPRLALYERQFAGTVEQPDFSEFFLTMSTITLNASSSRRSETPGLPATESEASCPSRCKPIWLQMSCARQRLSSLTEQAMRNNERRMTLDTHSPYL